MKTITTVIIFIIGSVLQSEAQFTVTAPTTDALLTKNQVESLAKFTEQVNEMAKHTEQLNSMIEQGNRIMEIAGDPQQVIMQAGSLFGDNTGASNFQTQLEAFQKLGNNLKDTYYLSNRMQQKITEAGDGEIFNRYMSYFEQSSSIDAAGSNLQTLMELNNRIQRQEALRQQALLQQAQSATTQAELQKIQAALQDSIRRQTEMQAKLDAAKQTYDLKKDQADVDQKNSETISKLKQLESVQQEKMADAKAAANWNTTKFKMGTIETTPVQETIWP